MPFLLPLTAPRALLKTVTHIGTLVARDKGQQGPSYEGDGVSFSVNPDAWVSIAKLGGSPWWEADVSGLSLLDGHALVQAHASSLADWAMEQGWITPAQEFVVSWFDDEANDTMEMVLGSRQAAEVEAEDLEEAEIQERHGFAPTAKLVERMRHASRDVGMPKAGVLDDVATVWARENGFAGIWWNDVLDPARLSAPRGVIFPEHVGSVTFVSANQPRPRRPRP